MTRPEDTTPDWLRPARAEFARLQPDAHRSAQLLARLTHLQQARRAHHATADAHEPRWLRSPPNALRGKRLDRAHAGR